MSDLTILIPEPEVVLLGRKKVKLYPVRLKDFELFGKSAQAVMGVMAAGSVSAINNYAVQHAAELRKVLRATTSLNRFQLWLISAPVAAQLIVQVVRANSGFFGEALPVMASALAGLQSPSA